MPSFFSSLFSTDPSDDFFWVKVAATSDGTSVAGVSAAGVAAGVSAAGVSEAGVEAEAVEFEAADPEVEFEEATGVAAMVELEDDVVFAEVVEFVEVDSPASSAIFVLFKGWPVCL